MKQIKKGDIVGRKSYRKDIIFIVTDIINKPEGKVAILTRNSKKNYSRQ